MGDIAHVASSLVLLSADRNIRLQQRVSGRVQARLNAARRWGSSSLQSSAQSNTLRWAGAAVTAVSNYYGSDARTFHALYVSEDSEIRTPRDLIGRSVAMNTLGAHAEAFVATWLRRAGLPAEPQGDRGRPPSADLGQSPSDDGFRSRRPEDRSIRDTGAWGRNPRRR